LVTRMLLLVRWVCCLAHQASAREVR
jgi:hypothetical protein